MQPMPSPASADPSRPLDLTLRIQGGSLSGRTRQLSAEDVVEGIVVGHGADCLVKFDALLDPAVAKHHAIIILRDDELVVLDIPGHGDVLLQGRPVPEGGCPLPNGARLQVGRHGPTLLVQHRGTTRRSTPPPIRLVRTPLPAAAVAPAPPQEAMAVLPASAPPVPEAVLEPVPLALSATMELTPVERPIVPSIAYEATLQIPPPAPRTEFSFDAPAATSEGVAGFVPGDTAAPPYPTIARRSRTRGSMVALFLAALAAGVTVFDVTEREAADERAQLVRRHLESKAARKLAAANAELERTRAAVSQARQQLTSTAAALLPYGPPDEDTLELVETRRALDEVVTTLTPPPR